MRLVSAARDNRLRKSGLNETHKRARNRLIVVRHPLLRFISGYKDILLAANHKDMQDFRMDVDTVSHSQNLSLIEAYTLVILNRTTNPHFQTFIDSCSPCQLDYNVIVKIDDHNGTSDFFTKSTFLTSESKQLFFEAKSSNANTNKIVRATWKSLLQGIQLHILEQLLEYYRKDFILFDYKIYRCGIIK